jgi:hypothetical protein
LWSPPLLPPTFDIITSSHFLLTQWLVRSIAASLAMVAATTGENYSSTTTSTAKMIII